MKTLLATLLLILGAAAASPGPTSSHSALNLLDTSDFSVCGSSVSGMNKHYVRNDELQSDPNAPAILRGDQEHDDPEDLQRHDHRLFRHNGFWMFADVAAWPPQTHFRCDPTRHDIDGVDTTVACTANLETPPRVGYAAVNRALLPLELDEQDCTKPVATPKAEL
jgi:hypothetical protein